MSKYIDLYNKAYKTQRPKAVAEVKKLFVEYKNKRSHPDKALNKIQSLLIEKEKNDITNTPEFSHLIDIYRNGRLEYENDYRLLAIINELHSAFKQISNPSISFTEYIKYLAIRECNNEVLRNFANKRELYHAMYKLGKFEGFQNLKEFDIVDYHIRNYFEIFEEIQQLAYPSNNANDKKKELINENNKDTDPIKELIGFEAQTNISIKQSNSNSKKKELIETAPFQFNKEYLEGMRSKEIYSHLKEEYFEVSSTTYNDYLNVFFNAPGNHTSKIKLNCETKLFATLLDQFKSENITKKLNYSKIGEFGIFYTLNNEPLTRANISNSLVNTTDNDLFIVQKTIVLIKKSNLKS